MTTAYGEHHPGPGHDADAIDERCRALHNAAHAIPRIEEHVETAASPEPPLTVDP